MTEAESIARQTAHYEAIRSNESNIGSGSGLTPMPSMAAMKLWFKHFDSLPTCQDAHLLRETRVAVRKHGSPADEKGRFIRVDCQKCGRFYGYAELKT
jgi:hypothetical protein